MADTRGQFFFMEDLDAVDDTTWWWVVGSKRSMNGREQRIMLQARTYPRDYVMTLRLFHGRRAPDYLGGSGDHIVSSRVKVVLEQFRCGDMRFIPVVVYDHADRKIVSKDYWCVLPDIGGGPSDESAGHHKQTYAAQLADPTLRDAFGIHFDHSTWTGLDVFELPNESTLILTKPVADALLAAGLHGVKIGDILDLYKDLRDKLVQIPLDEPMPAPPPSARKGPKPRGHG